MPNGFVIEQPDDSIVRGTTRGNPSAVVKCRGKVVASLAWYRQNKILAFLIHDASVHVYESAQEAIDDIVLQTLKQRLKGDL